MDKRSRYETARLILRGIGPEDAGAIVRWRSDPANYGVFFRQSPLTMGEHMEWYRGYVADESRYDFAIVERETGASVGTATLSRIDRTSGSCEVSYMLGERSARGKGYATEAVEALCAAARDELGIRTVEARILLQNARSRAVAERAGFDEAYRVYRRRLA